MRKTILALVLGVGATTVAFVLPEDSSERGEPAIAAIAAPVDTRSYPDSPASTPTPVMVDSDGLAREAALETEVLASAGVRLEDRMRFVDGIELQSSNAVFEWLLSEEGRDESWAVPMEAELYEYFRTVPYFAQNFGVPYIHCRESMCGLQVIGYGEDAAENGIRAIADMESRSWKGVEKLDTRIGMDEIRSDAIGFVFYTLSITEEAP